MAAQNLTAERLRELLSYDPDTGVFTRLVRTSNRVKIGDVAGKLTPYGYLQIWISHKHFQAHRLAWLYVYGRFPFADLDHINGIRDDNRIANLREATRAENMQNLSLLKANTSGFTGASFDKTCGRWTAMISINGKKTRLGRFDTVDAAHDAYIAAKAKYHTFQPTIRR